MAQKKKPVQSDLAKGLIVPTQVGRSKEDWIGNQLQKVYDEALTEDIPDDMLSLLDQLDNQSSGDDSAQEESTQ
ncbi:NepR family anti-sigma factor [Roseibium sp.]|uniref:NepR family anti-sigma factor n=1 Tax=Roseibium sp. TaxID=1936156 RepID=UPI003A96B0D2